MRDAYPELEPIRAKYVAGFFDEVLADLEVYWNALPIPKEDISNSYMVISYGVAVGLKLGNLDEAWKWSQRGLAYSGNVNPAGESEFLNGEVAFARGDMATAAQYFEAARRMSGWRLFKGENPAYRKLAGQCADSCARKDDGASPDAAGPVASEAIRTAVWSGYCSSEDVEELIVNLVNEGGDERLLRKVAKREFDAKLAAEKSWPEHTDCDLLDGAFAALEKRGILCLQNAGYTVDDGHQDAFDGLSDMQDGSFTGYCFFHGQDLERAINGEGLMLAFDHVEGDVPEKVEVGRIVKEELERVGFEVGWNGNPGERICIPKIHWRRRYRVSP